MKRLLALPLAVMVYGSGVFASDIKPANEPKPVIEQLAEKPKDEKDIGKFAKGFLTRQQKRTDNYARGPSLQFLNSYFHQQSFMPKEQNWQMPSVYYSDAKKVAAREAGDYIADRLEGTWLFDIYLTAQEKKKGFEEHMTYRTKDSRFASEVVVPLDHKLIGWATEYKAGMFKIRGDIYANKEAGLNFGMTLSNTNFSYQGVGINIFSGKDNGTGISIVYRGIFK